MDGDIRYLNTDLELTSADDLTALAAAFEAAGLPPLHVTRGENGLWHGCFETDEAHSEPEPNVAAMLAVIESLAPPLRSVWTGCSRREFNVGYDCGLEPWAFNQGLSAELLRRVAATGASLRITLYPDREPGPPTLPDPAIVLDLIQGFRYSKIMFTAVELGVFDHLANGPKRLDALARDLATNADALERLLDACVGLRLLAKNENGYANTPVASSYLVKTSPRRLTGYVTYSNDVTWKLWANLEDAVREGTHRWKQTFGWDGPIFAHFFKDEYAKREFLMGMHGYGLISSPAVVAAFDLGRFRQLVDLGGGTGHLAIAACQHYPSLRATVFDLPEALPLARETISQSPVAARIELVAGDFFTDPLAEGDLFALGRIVHDWTEAKILKLLKRIHERLPGGGGILIAEKLLDDDKSGPLWAQTQSLNMLCCTEGKERTLGEYAALLEQVGFADVNGCRTTSPLDAVLAIKRS